MEVTLGEVNYFLVSVIRVLVFLFPQVFPSSPLIIVCCRCINYLYFFLSFRGLHRSLFTSASFFSYTSRTPKNE